MMCWKERRWDGRCSCTSRWSIDDERMILGMMRMIGDSWQSQSTLIVQQAERRKGGGKMRLRGWRALARLGMSCS